MLMDYRGGYGSGLRTLVAAADHLRSRSPRSALTSPNSFNFPMIVGSISERSHAPGQNLVNWVSRSVWEAATQRSTADRFVCSAVSCALRRSIPATSPVVPFASLICA
jgi:hypothetical protein